MPGRATESCYRKIANPTTMIIATRISVAADVHHAHSAALSPASSRTAVASPARRSLDVHPIHLSLTRRRLWAVRRILALARSRLLGQSTREKAAHQLDEARECPEEEEHPRQKERTDGVGEQGSASVYSVA